MAALHLRPIHTCGFDAATLGEIMLRFDLGEGRIFARRGHSARGRAEGSTTSRESCAAHSISAAQS